MSTYEYQKLWRAKNADKLRERNRQWMWGKRHPELKDKVGAWDALNSPDLWRGLMKNKCVACGKKLVAEGEAQTQADYIARGNYCAHCTAECDERAKEWSKNQQENKFMDLFRQVPLIHKLPESVPLDTVAPV